MAAGGRSLGAIWASLFARRAHFTKEVAATKKNPKQFTHLGFGSLLPQSGFFSWAAGVGGWGAAQLGLIRPHLAAHRAYSMPCGVIEHDDGRRIAEHLANRPGREPADD